MQDLMFLIVLGKKAKNLLDSTDEDTDTITDDHLHRTEVSVFVATVLLEIAEDGSVVIFLQ